jgi:hypothetical protein
MYKLPDVPGAALTMREKLRGMICKAFIAGLSPIEISRVTGSKKTLFVYQTLRKAGIVKPMHRGKPRKVQLNPDIALFFDNIDFSVAKWCSVWGFSTAEVIDAFSVQNPVKDRDLEIHKAMVRDFPDKYLKMFTNSFVQNLPVLRLVQGLVTPQSKLNVTIRYDPLNERYMATTVDYSDLIGYGNSWANAANDLEKVYWMYKSLVRLQHALDNLEISRNTDSIFVLKNSLTVFSN